MAEVGALIVGIGAYRYSRRDQFSPLLYADADAIAIEHYVRTCWGDKAHIVRVPESEATHAGIESGFTTLAARGPYELQLFFFSGHGLVDATHAGLLLQPDPGEGTYRLVEAMTLDRLMASVKAKRTIAIIDCCYAEGVVRRMNFFTGLGGDMARLYVASSRETQRTWEDDRAGHGIFTAHLLDLVNTGSSAQLSGMRDRLDVDGELFPILCEQVPLYVLANKNEIQEPVKGGVASAAVKLPVVRAARRLQERTALGTALRRVRQIGLSMLGVTAVMLLFAYSMLYYIEPDSDGSLSLRRGTRWLEPVFRILPTTRVDTGIGPDALSSNPAASRNLTGGYSTGIWTHTTKGSRSWYDTVAAGLDDRAARTLDILMGHEEVTPAQALDEQALPNDVAFAAWAALAAGRADDLSTVLEHIPVEGGNPNSTFNPNFYDFQILDRSASDMQTFAQALAYAAALDADQTLPTYIAFLKGTQAWLTHNRDTQRGRDARELVRNAVADVLGVAGRARRDRDLPSLDEASTQLLEALSRQGYSEMVDTALSRLTSSAAGQTAATRSLATFRGGVDPDQLRALDAIRRGLDGSSLARSRCNEVIGRFDAAGNNSNVYRTGFLIDAADRQSLSLPVINRLLEEARTALQRQDLEFEDIELARILAHGMGQIAPEQRDIAYRLIDLTLANNTQQAQASAEILGSLGNQRLDRPGMFAKVSEQAHKALAYAPMRKANEGSSLPGTTFLVGYGPWLVALAQFGQTRQLAPRDADLLLTHLPDPALSALIVQALAAQELHKAGSDWPEQWADELGRFPTRADLRSYRQGVMTTKLAVLPRPAFLNAIERLRIARDKEREPEVRIAIGMIIADASYWRVRPQEPESGLR